VTDSPSQLVICVKHAATGVLNITRDTTIVIAIKIAHILLSFILIPPVLYTVQTTHTGFFPNEGIEYIYGIPDI
jgi:hypothetical protein